MAPKKRNSNTRFERLAALATPLPALAEEGDTSQPQASTATGEVTEGTGMPLSFLVRFVESSPSMSLRFEARGDQLAKEAVEWASDLAMLKFSAGLEANASDLTSYPSYPPTLPNGRELTVEQWLKMGHNPFVAVTSPKHIGFFSQREEARAELQKSREANSVLINAVANSDLEESSQEVKQADMCAGCKKLSAALVAVEQENRLIKAENAALNTRVTAQDTRIAAQDTRIAAQDTRIQQLQSTQIQELLVKMGDLQKVRRRSIIEKARKKILKGLKKSKSDVSSSWETFFTNHDAQIRALGVSNSLFAFLSQGKSVLNKTVHEAHEFEMANAVLSLKEGTVERLQFAEAFKFAFDTDVESFFSDAEDE